VDQALPGAHNPMPVDPNAPHVKVGVFCDGRLLVDGEPATIESLRASFRRLSEQRGVVWYYRENPGGQASPLAEKVIAEIIAARLSVRLSTKPDYSDAFVPKTPPAKPKAN
jgi:hypothetical protein